jgi:hypothetical protein
VQEDSPYISNPLDFFMTLFRSGFSYSTRNFSDEQVALMGETLRDVMIKGKTIRLLSASGPARYPHQGDERVFQGL